MFTNIGEGFIGDATLERSILENHALAILVNIHNFIISTFQQLVHQ